MAMLSNNNFFGNAALSDDMLNKQVASGQTLGTEMTGELSGSDQFSKADPLTEPRATGVFDSPGINSQNDQFTPETQVSNPNATGPQDDALNSPNIKPTLSPGQTVGLAALSAGAQMVANDMNLKSQEKEAINNINREYAQFEFTHRLNRSARKISEMRSMINSIKNIGRQAPAVGSNVQTQQFTQSPTQGVLLNA